MKKLIRGVLGWLASVAVVFNRMFNKGDAAANPAGKGTGNEARPRRRLVDGVDADRFTRLCVVLVIGFVSLLGAVLIAVSLHSGGRRIPLAECAVYLATSPKSNSAYMGINSALELVKNTGNQPVPLHLRNAPTQLMAELGYSDGYKYAHDYPGNFVEQQFLPDTLKDKRLWHAQHTPSEEKLYQRMIQCWGKRFED